MTRGLRNNNPLNIRYSSQNMWRGQVSECERTDGEFCEFVTMEAGFRAAFKLIRRYIREYRLTTPSAIISRWAPRSENDTDAYVQATFKTLTQYLWHTAAAEVDNA